MIDDSDSQTEYAEFRFGDDLKMKGIKLRYGERIYLMKWHFFLG